MFDPVLGGAAIEDARVLDVPAGEVAQRSLALVLVLDQLALAARLAGLGRVLARSGLDRGLLVATHDEVAGVQALSLPAPLVQVEDRPGLDLELGVAPQDPGAVVPWADRVFGQPPPHGHAGDPLDDSARDRLAGELRRGPARQRHALLGGQLARQRDDLSVHLWGKKSGAGPAAVGPPARPSL